MRSAPVCLRLAGYFSRSCRASRHMHLRDFHSSTAAWKSFQLPVPKMGDSITEGTLLKLLKAPGEAVAIDEIVAVIETDKVTVDVRASEAGIVTAVHAKAQDTVAVGALLFTMDTDGSASVAPASAAAAPVKPTAAAIPPSAASVPSAAVHSAAASTRKPGIHFRHGVRDSESASHGAPGSAATGGGAVGGAGAGAGVHADFGGDFNAHMAQMYPSKATKSYYDLPPQFGRPPLSIQESFAIDTGGCEYVAPPPEGGKKGKM